MDNILRPLRPVEGANRTPGQPPHLEPTTSIATASPAPSPAATNTSDSSKKQTCLQCRVRKVKCDGRQKTCQNCERLEFECSFQQSPGQPAAPYAAKLPERRRRMQACLACRSKKIRCLGELPECSNCTKKGLVCSYPEPRKKVPTAGSSHGGDSYAALSADHDGHSDLDVTGSTGEAALDQDTVTELVEDYFRHLYPLPSYAFLHKATVVQRCQDRTIDTPLKLAICATTSLLLRRTSLCHDIWIQLAEQSILQHLGQPSIFRLQALLLIVRYRIESGDFPTAFMLAALAARSAVGLRLNFERAELPPLAQEARRRLFWSLFLLDDFFCVGLREFELCPRETIHLQLPCDEELFEVGKYCRTGTLQQDPLEVPATIGLRGIFLRLVSLRREVMRFIRQVGLKELQPSSIGASIQRFEQELKCLHAGLSQSEQYSVFNLVNCKMQTQFIMLHLSWNQCFCDLYRQFLSGFSEAAPSPVLAGIPPANKQMMQQRCVEHAENNIQIVTDFWNNCSRSSILERDTAVCAFEAARIVMYTASLSSNWSMMDTGIRKGRLCLDLITHFFSQSAATKALRNKLERIISGYSDRLALQNKEALREPDPPETRPSGRISQYANSRQRLSVQSLLLQSDFVDDSDQIAVPAQTSGPHNPRREDSNPKSQGASAETSADVPALDDRMSLDEVPEETATPHGIEGYEETGVELNPWMGFPGKDDVYGIPGLSGDLDAEY
ncbi:putative Zn(2)-C6 fungal-type domain-containing protein [Seiridium unicorne]|uniref:Zn(2)-C6 fungal-type domain-containing protein n=1 Tax=Seiridium unicorne TaxID=138068 RepID=A0ABR2VEE5_9PEZI